MEDARARALLFWERRAIALANGEAGNAAVVALGLKSRSRAASGWHDAERIEHSGPEGTPVQIAARLTINVRLLTVDQREALKRAILTAMSAAEASRRVSAAVR